MFPNSFSGSENPKNEFGIYGMNLESISTDFPNLCCGAGQILGVKADTHYLPGLRFSIWWARKNRCNPNRIQILQILTQGDFMPELGFVGFRLGFANPRFELRQLMGVSFMVCETNQNRFIYVSVQDAGLYAYKV